MCEIVDIKRVQDVLFEMAKNIATILEKNNIPYMIAFGTLLGAVRHKDLIPWDDDFDFYLFEDTYQTAIAVLRKELPNNMFVEDEISEPLYFHSWAHIKDLNSETSCELFPQDSLYAHKGISVDLYKTRRMKILEVEPFLKEENKKYIIRRKKKGLISEEEYITRLQKLAENKNTPHKCADENEDVFSLIPVYKCHYIRASSVFPLRKYTIRNQEFYGPNDADCILTSIYGDYMKLPPKEKRTCHYSSVKFLESQ